MDIKHDTYLALLILDFVAAHYELSLKEMICGKSGKARLARGSAVYGIRRCTKLPIQSVASFLGYKNLHTCLFALRSHEAEIRNDSQLQKVQRLIEDFISTSEPRSSEPQTKSNRNENLPLANDDSDTRNKWNQILAYLESRFCQTVVYACFDDVKVVQFTDNSLIIDAGSELRCQIIRQRYVASIQDALMELYRSNAVVEVVSSDYSLKC